MKSANVFVHWHHPSLRNLSRRVSVTQLPLRNNFKRGIGLWLLVLLFSSFVSGCASHKTEEVVKSKRDGAPKHIPHNLDKVPDAKPKIEPLSPCGNRYKKGTYVTRKKKYKVLTTSRHYRAKGIASWYGTRFHGRKTSSGEPYDMFAMTAAHRTLPLPTYVKIKNLDNGKTAIVKINDRGPFHGNRLIDLSYVAAHKLGILATGTARVEVVSVDPRDHKGSRFAKKELAAKEDLPIENKSTNKTKTNPKIKLAAAKPNDVKSSVKKIPQQKLFVQLGRYPEKSKAEAALKKIGPLAKEGALIRTVKSKESTHFLVRIGPFQDRAAAHALRQKLVALKLSPTVVTQE